MVEVHVDQVNAICMVQEAFQKALVRGVDPDRAKRMFRQAVVYAVTGDLRGTYSMLQSLDSMGLNG